MRLDTDVLDGFSPDLYLATLSEVAHADGLHPSERSLLENRAHALGVDLQGLPLVPEDLSDLSWPMKVLVFRDALTLAFADGQVSDGERAHLDGLARRLGLPADGARRIESWLRRHDALLGEFEELLLGAQGDTYDAE